MKGKNLKKKALAKAIAGVFVCTAFCIPFTKADALTIGGLNFELGTDGYQRNMATLGTPLATWTFNSKDAYVAEKGGFQNVDLSTLTRDDRVQWNSLAQGTGSIGGLIHDTNRNLYINKRPEQVATGFAYAPSIVTLAIEGGSANIENNGGGNIIWQARDGAQNVVLANGLGSSAVISNNNGKIEFGRGDYNIGKYLVKDGGKAVIENNGSGEILFEGSRGWIDAEISSITYLAYGQGASIDIVNRSDGVINIVANKEGDVITEMVGGDGVAKIINEETGVINIIGQDGNDAIGNVNGSIVNKKYGKVNIISKMTGNAISSIAGGVIENEGKIVIEGGVDGGSGIGNIAGGTVRGAILNNTGGEVTLKSNGNGSAIEVIGTRAIFESPGVGEINNANAATLNIIGTESSPAINHLAYGPALIYGTEALPAEVLFTNEGRLVLNKYAIGAFIKPVEQNVVIKPSSKPLPSGHVQIINKANGQIYVEAGALFSGQYDAPSNDSDPPEQGGRKRNIFILNKDGGVNKVITDKFEYPTPIIQNGNLILKDDWRNFSKWESGGSIYFTDVAAETALAESIKSQFEAAFGTGTTINFTGTGSGSGSGSSTFDMNVVNALISEGKLASGSVVTSEALTHTGKAFTLGTTGDMTQDTGFMGIQGSTGITVKDGKTLTLMGSQATMAMAVGADARDANYVITDAPMSLTHGNLNLGHANLSATEGKLAAVTYDNQSTVNINNGIFTFESLKGNGAVTVAETSRATVTGDFQTANATNSGTLTVNGKTTLSQSPVTGASTYAVNRNGFTNQKGTANFKGGLEIGKGTSLTNMAGATVNAGAITMNELGTINAVAGSTINATSFDQNGIMRMLGTLNITGTMTVGDNSNTTLGGESTIGTLTVGRTTPTKLASGTDFFASPMGAQLRLMGKHYVDELDFVSGTVSVDDGATLTGKTLKDGEIGSTITVANGGTFGFSHNKSSLDSVLKNYVGETDNKAILALNTDLHFGNGGSLTVGTVNDARGTVNLGSDSLLLLGTTDLHGEALLNGTSAQQLHVEDGATIAMTDDLMWGNHYILKGFDKPSSDEVMHVGIKDKDGKAMTLNKNDHGLFITIGSDNILDKDKSFRMVNQMNWLLDGHQNTKAEQGDVAFLTSALLAKNGAEATNRMEALASDAGVMAETQRMTAQVQTTMLDHATSARKGYGTFWVDGVFADIDSGAFERSAGTSSYDVDTTGFVFGADLPVAEDYRLGVAFSAQRGDLDGQHGLSSDIEGYGLSVYGGYTFASGLNVSSSLSYVDTTHEVSTFNLGAVKANVDATAWMLGGRVSMPYAFNRMWLTPYVGFDVMKINQDAFATSWSGKEAFQYAETDATILRTPVGIKAGTFVPLEMFGRSGTLNWDADLAFIPQFGDTEADYRVSGVSNGHSDGYEGAFANDWLSTLQLGISWQGAVGAFGIHYGVEKGDVRNLSHSVKAKASLYF